MEIGIAVYALLVPFLFRWIDDLYALIWQQLHPGYFTFSLWRFVLSGLVLLVPTTLMGATLPVLAAALMRSSERDSNSVTRLYACNLAGAILGTLAAGFLLLPALGVRMTIAVAAVLNVIVGVIAIVFAASDTMTRHANLLSMLKKILSILSPTFGTSQRSSPASSTISAQVSWTRTLTMIIGSSTYAFSIVVALFLIGLAFGAWLVARKDRSQRLRSTILKVEALTALSLLLSLYVLNKIPALLDHSWLAAERFILGGTACASDVFSDVADSRACSVDGHGDAARAGLGQ